MRTTLTIDDDVFDVARNLARHRGISLGKAVSLLARRGAQGKISTVGTASDTATDRYPVFSVAEDAPTFGPDAVARALDNE